MIFLLEETACGKAVSRSLDFYKVVYLLEILKRTVWLGSEAKDQIHTLSEEIAVGFQISLSSLPCPSDKGHRGGGLHMLF